MCLDLVLSGGHYYRLMNVRIIKTRGGYTSLVFSLLQGWGHNLRHARMILSIPHVLS